MTQEVPKVRDLDVEAASAILDRALEGQGPRTRKPTKTERFQELKPKIDALKAKGYSWAEIASLLRDVGGGNKDTLRYAVGEKAVKKKRRAHAEPKRKANAQAAQEPRVEQNTQTGNDGSEVESGRTSASAAPEAKPVDNHQWNEHAATRRAGRKP